MVLILASIFFHVQPQLPSDATEHITHLSSRGPAVRVLAESKKAVYTAKNVRDAAHRLRRTGERRRSDPRGHLSSYRSRRRVKIGGPVVSLEGGIIQNRSFTDVKFVLLFGIYAGLMVSVPYRMNLI